MFIEKNIIISWYVSWRILLSTETISKAPIWFHYRILERYILVLDPFITEILYDCVFIDCKNELYKYFHSSENNID